MLYVRLEYAEYNKMIVLEILQNVVNSVCSFVNKYIACFFSVIYYNFAKQDSTIPTPTELFTPIQKGKHHTVFHY